MPFVSYEIRGGRPFRIFVLGWGVPPVPPENELAPMSKYSVRLLVPDEAEAFRDMRLEGLQKHPTAFMAEWEEESRRPLGWFMDRLKTNAVFGGFNESETFLGVIAVGQGQNSKTMHNAHIWGVYVKPEARGTGLAKLLLDAAVSHALARCLTVRLTVEENNQAARRLYRAAGFREWATDFSAIQVDGIFHNEILMRLDRP